MSPFSDTAGGQRNDLSSSGMTRQPRFRSYARSANSITSPELVLPKIEWRSVLALLTAGLIVSTGAPLQTPSLGEAVENASTQIVDNLADDDSGPHLGFDTFAYPGDDAMRA